MWINCYRENVMEDYAKKGGSLSVKVKTLITSWFRPLIIFIEKTIGNGYVFLTWKVVIKVYRESVGALLKLLADLTLPRYFLYVRDVHSSVTPQLWPDCFIFMEKKHGSFSYKLFTSLFRSKRLNLIHLTS